MSHATRLLVTSFVTLLAIGGCAVDESPLGSEQLAATNDGKVAVECGASQTIIGYGQGAETAMVPIGDLAYSCEAAREAVDAEQCDSPPGDLDDKASAKALSSCAEDTEDSVVCVDAEGDPKEDCKPTLSDDQCALDGEFHRKAWITSECRTLMFQGRTLFQAQCGYESWVNSRGVNTISCVECDEEQGGEEKPGR